MGIAASLLRKNGFRLFSHKEEKEIEEFLKENLSS